MQKTSLFELLGKFRGIFPLILLMEHILQHLLSTKNLWKKWRYSPYQQVSLPDVFQPVSWLMTRHHPSCRTHHWGPVPQRGLVFLKSTEPCLWAFSTWAVEVGWVEGGRIWGLEMQWIINRSCFWEHIPFKKLKGVDSYLKVFLFQKNKGWSICSNRWLMMFGDPFLLFLVCLASHFVGGLPTKPEGLG